MEALYKALESHTRGRAYFFMHILAVLPEYQRQRGWEEDAGGGLKQADELGVECPIDATPAGLGLYSKLVTIDLEPYGGKPGEKGVDVQLVRPL